VVIAIYFCLKFAIQTSQDVEVVAATNDYFQLVITGAEPSLILKPFPEIYKRHAVSFTVEPCGCQLA
jgi:hypothetical protein